MDDINSLITKEMLEHFHELLQQKKRTEEQLEKFKKIFNQFFDLSFGEHAKGEIVIDKYTLQRQVRTLEKYDQDKTVKRLESLQLEELLVKKADDKKIKSALDLGLLSEADLDGCKKVAKFNVVTVKPTKNS